MNKNEQNGLKEVLEEKYLPCSELLLCRKFVQSKFISIDRLYFQSIDSSGHPVSCRSCRIDPGETKKELRIQNKS
jgi:hypothetical protein